jgi:hypothetical protein
MKIKSSKIKNIKSKLNSENGFPKPKKAKCFQCKKNFLIKFVIPRQDYSQKNNWDYWTNEETNKVICDTCLLTFYYNKPLYWNLVKDKSRRLQMKTYIYHGIITA